jgi:hypothetical protein
MFENKSVQKMANQMGENRIDAMCCKRMNREATSIAIAAVTCTGSCVLGISISETENHVLYPYSLVNDDESIFKKTASRLNYWNRTHQS